MIKKYMVFSWVIDGSGWSVKDTLEEAKGIWDFGKIVFEIDAEDEADLKTYGQEVKSNRLILDRLKQKYPIVYQEHEPPEYLITK